MPCKSSDLPTKTSTVATIHNSIMRYSIRFAVYEEIKREEKGGVPEVKHELITTSAEWKC